MQKLCCFIFGSMQLPSLDGQPTITALDLQIKTLRDAAVGSIRQMASCVREEATDVKSTVVDIEEWLERIRQLAEEVCDAPCKHIRSSKRYHSNFFFKCYVFLSLRTACQM